MMLRAALILLAILFSPQASAQWMEARSNHFTVYSEGTAAEVEDYVAGLERFDQAVRALRGIPSPPVNAANRVTVFVLPSTNDIEALSGRSGVAGFFIPRGTGPVAFVPKRASVNRNRSLSSTRNEPALGAQEVLFHEYAHYVMFSAFPNVAFPAWYVEGFAEFHATAAINEDGSVQFGAVPQYRALGLQSGNHFALDKMLAGERPSNMMANEAIYGRGWALTHYLQFNADRKPQLAEYLSAINSGKPAKDAIKVFGDLGELHRELERYISSSRFPGLRVPASSIDIGKITVRPLTAGEAALMDVRMRSKRGVAKKDADGVFSRAKRASDYPGDAGAQIVLAEAAYDAEEFDAAEAAADQAIAADPTAIDAWIYKAMAQLGRAKKAKNTKPETLASARKAIGQANKLNPLDPEPLALFYQSFAQHGQAPTELAKDGMVRAFELAPYDATYRLAAAYVLLGDSDAVTARQLLLPLTFDAHGRPQAKTAREAVEMIDAKKLVEAQQKLRALALGEATQAILD